MICTIHQPEINCWLGLIDKILQSDVFVCLNIAQFEKNYWGNRVIIRTKDNTQLLTIPVESHNHKPYNELQIIYQHNWQKSFLQSIKQNYSKAKYFNDIFPEIENIINKKHSSLAELNIEILRFILSKFNYQGKITLTSDLNLNMSLTATDMLVEICKKVGANTYLSGSGGHSYLEEQKFKDNDISLVYQTFFYPVYNQVYKQQFIPNLSSLDLLMCYGPESRKVLFCKGGICLRNILDTIPNWQEKSILEMFSGNGLGHLSYYGNEVKDLTLWELNVGNCENLDYLYPQAYLKQTDSLEEIKTNSSKFDIIIIDAPANIEITPILSYIERLINRTGVIVIRAIKVPWREDLTVKPTPTIEECQVILAKTLKVTNSYEKPREFVNGKMWLSNYVFEIENLTN